MYKTVIIFFFCLVFAVTFLIDWDTTLDYVEVDTEYLSNSPIAEILPSLPTVIEGTLNVDNGNCKMRINFNENIKSFRSIVANGKKEGWKVLLNESEELILFRKAQKKSPNSQSAHKGRLYQFIVADDKNSILYKEENFRMP